MSKIKIVDSPRPEDADEDRVFLGAFRQALEAIDRAVSKVIPRPGSPSLLTLPDDVEEMAHRILQMRAEAALDRPTLAAYREANLLARRLAWAENAESRKGSRPEESGIEWGAADTSRPQPIDRAALVKLHGDITSGLLGDEERRDLRDTVQHRGEARAALKRDEVERDIAAQLADALGLED